SGADPGIAARRPAASRVAWAGVATRIAPHRASAQRSAVGKTRPESGAPGSLSLNRVASRAAIRSASRPHRTTELPAAAAALASAMPHAPAPATPTTHSLVTPARPVSPLICAPTEGARLALRERRDAAPPVERDGAICAPHARAIAAAPSQNAVQRLGRGRAVMGRERAATKPGLYED